ncbi:MAG: hypothetical protein K2Q03_00530, partial [Sphingobacteriaceae bacterium]|nr:hypothetical protein [Sphingobacteriaceae bacterium]
LNIANLIFGQNLTGNVTTPAGNIGIGNAAPDESAVLEVSSTNKGILLPRVALTSTANISPIVVTPAEGLTVLNTATTGDVRPGYYRYSAAGKWEPLTPFISSSNGITNTNGDLKLGGTLSQATVLTTTAINTLAITGLQQTTTLVGAFKVLTVEPNGTLTTQQINSVTNIPNGTACPYLVKPTDQTLYISNSSGCTYTLPTAASSMGREVTFHRAANNGATITINVSGSGQIEAIPRIASSTNNNIAAASPLDTSAILVYGSYSSRNAYGSSVTYQSNGSVWFIKALR